MQYIKETLEDLWTPAPKAKKTQQTLPIKLENKNIPDKEFWICFKDILGPSKTYKLKFSLSIEGTKIEFTTDKSQSNNFKHVTKLDMDREGSSLKSLIGESIRVIVFQTGFCWFDSSHLLFLTLIYSGTEIAAFDIELSSL